MTFAEVILLVAGIAGIYFLLRPLQRRLERFFIAKFFAHYPRGHRPTIDVTDFTSHSTHKKDDHEHRV